MNIKPFNFRQDIQIFMKAQTPKSQQELFFHERTNTFDLSLALLGDQRLTITMKDFVDYIIYEKEYTEDDIGQEIHRKIDLAQVYEAFINIHQGDQLKRYQFGTIVEIEIGNKKIPCYRIEKGGKITAYWSTHENKINKDVIYESKLMLTKVRNMTDVEILTERTTIENDHLFKELRREIQKIREEKAGLEERVNELEEENVRVKKELRTTIQELKEEVEEFEKKINQENQAKKNLEAVFNSTKEDLGTKIQKLQKELEAKIDSTKQEFKEKFAVQNQRSLGKFAEIDQTLKPIKDMAKLMSLPQAYSNQFNLNGCKVQYAGTNGSWTQFIFNQPINPSQTANFKIKIIKTKSNCIMVGVVDYAKQKEQRCSFISGNIMCYYGNGGQKYPQREKEGDGFKWGDVVEVQVDRATSTINYIVNGFTKATSNNSMLTDNIRVFMPYVEMYSTNDVVEWLL